MERPDRKAGIFLIVTALTTIIAVIGRVAADADQDTLAESISQISEYQLLYGLGGIGRAVSGVTLIVGAWFLIQTWIIKDRYATSWVPYLFIGSGIFTAVSGICAVLLTTADPASITSTTETIATLRWLTGKTGFSFAGVALIVAARFQYMVGGNLRRISPATLLLGIALNLIWIDLDTTIHGIIGALFVLWLVAIGSMLFTGRVERHFTQKFDL